MKLDAIDLRIIKLLEENSQLTKAELAEKVKLSVSPCWARVKKLEKHKVISGYHAQIDLKQITRSITLFVQIYLQSYKKSTRDIFEESIKPYPEIIECYLVGGGIDYILKVVVADITHFQKIFDCLLEEDIGIERYNSYITARHVKESKSSPIESLIEENLSNS